jgi:multidrug transporter EmrE-like cation transporter
MIMALVTYAWLGIAPLSNEIIFWAILSGIIHGVYILCLSRAYSTADISYVYPIARSAPVFVPVFAWLLLDETLNISTFFAIGLILIAIYSLHFEGRVIQGFKKLIWAMGHQDLRWAFYTLAMVVSYSLVDKKGMDSFLIHSPDHPFANGITFFSSRQQSDSLYATCIFLLNIQQNIFFKPGEMNGKRPYLPGLPL